MHFLTPLGLALAALAVPIVALYFLKLRRADHPVSSTYLWRTLVRDAAANAPWQRLRANLLLALQLLALALLVLALARPYILAPAAAGDHLILIVDTSASMQATDVAPNRLAAAVAEARRLVAGLPAAARVTVIAAGGKTASPVSATTDRAAVDRSLASLAAGNGESDLSEAVELAAALAAREQDPETVILSDGNVTLPAQATLPGRVRFVPVGRTEADNQGLLAFSLRPSATGQTLSAFVQAANFGPRPVERRLALYAGGQLLAARTLALPPGQPQPFTFDDLPANAGVVQARLEGADALAADDSAWAVPPPATPLRVELVSAGNRFLDTALGLLPGVQVTTTAPADYHPAACADCETADLTIFDAVPVTTTLPSGGLLFVAPVQASGLFSVTGRISQPSALPGRGDDPLLRFVDLKGLQIQEAAAVPLPAWARPVLLDSSGSAACAARAAAAGTPVPAVTVQAPITGTAAACPLLFVGDTQGHRVGVLAFDLRQSDLALRVAFPLLTANLVDYLAAGGRPGQPAAVVHPFDPLPVTGPAQVTRPDGRTVSLPAGAAAYGDTDALGVYRVEPAAGKPATYTVNLFSRQESALAGQSTLPLAAAGQTGQGGAPPAARVEWWRPLAWLALAALIAEWLYAHRGRLRGRLGRPAGSPGEPANRRARGSRLWR